MWPELKLDSPEWKALADNGIFRCLIANSSPDIFFAAQLRSG